MAANSFIQEMHSVGERLLAKLQRLPEADTVELVAFSIIVIFTGKWGIQERPTCGSRQRPGRGGSRPRRKSGGIT